MSKEMSYEEKVYIIMWFIEHGYKDIPCNVLAEKYNGLVEKQWLSDCIDDERLIEPLTEHEEEFIKHFRKFLAMEESRRVK